MLDSLPIRIPQVTFHREIFAEAVKFDCLNIRGIAYSTKAGAGGEWNRTGAGEEFGRIIKENFGHDVGRQGGPVNLGATFNEQAGDFHLSEAAGNRTHLGTAVGSRGWNLFHPNATL